MSTKNKKIDIYNTRIYWNIWDNVQHSIKSLNVSHGRNTFWICTDLNLIFHTTFKLKGRVIKDKEQNMFGSKCTNQCYFYSYLDTRYIHFVLLLLTWYITTIQSLTVYILLLTIGTIGIHNIVFTVENSPVLNLLQWPWKSTNTLLLREEWWYS